jgi:hypothetical protein
VSDKLNDIARLEKAISERWGEETIQNPKADWSEDKEKKYLEQIFRTDQRPNRQDQPDQTCRGEGRNRWGFCFF